ncbi:MAG TPA: tRNA guanosine(15) transglycosylase TgtA [Sulfolobales archaeon]|nr:tRNA guanosine(15) transglycosylase TgtA [Sulfolobales archaeon]
MPESFQIKDKDLMGRIGVIETKNGRLETPVFLPVIDPVEQVGDKAILPASEIEKMGFKAVITNAYLIKKTYGESAIEKGVRGTIGFNGVVMTDSGAYQHMVYGSVDVGNREIVEFQERLGSDIAVILDIPTKESSSYSEALYSVEETLRRAREVIDIVSRSETLWVLPIQGGAYLDLVRRSAREARGLDGYSIYAIGSPVTFLQSYRYSKIIDMIITAKEELFPSYPVHLFGAGHPMILPFAIALGIDMFDSASYILYAKDNRYITEYGTERVEELEVFPCNCPVCSKYSPKDLLEMDRRERIGLIARHNLYMIDKEVRRVKTYIREGRLWDLLVERSRSHPSLLDAMSRIIMNSDKIERYSPYSKGRRGLFIYDSISRYKPQMIRTMERLSKYLSYVIEKRVPGMKIVAMIPGDYSIKPFSNSPIYTRALEDLSREALLEEVFVFFYTPYFGIVPEDLEETYPFSQHEAPETIDLGSIGDLGEEIYRLVTRIKSGVPRIIIYYSKEIPWSVETASILRKRLAGPYDEIIVLREI